MATKKSKETKPKKYILPISTAICALILSCSVGSYFILKDDTKNNTIEELNLPTTNSFSKKEIEGIQASVTNASPSASVVQYAGSSLSFSGDTDEYDNQSKKTTSLNANEQAKYREVNYTEFVGKGLKSDTKSLKGTETYLDYFERNSKYQNKNYEIKDYLLNKYKDNLAVYNHNPILYDAMLTQDAENYFVFAYSPTCLYTNNFVVDTLQYYIDSTHSLPVYTLNLDILENKEILANFNVRGTPSLLYIQKGKVTKITTGVTNFGYLHNFESNLENTKKK